MVEFKLKDLADRGINPYQAVIMASQEARFINDQMKLGVIDEKKKPTTISLNRLFEGQVVENVDSEG